MDRMGYPVYLMESQQKVLFYGNSLVLSGIQASLKTCPGLEVLALDSPATEKELLTLDPSVVIFDMAVVEPEFLIAQMHALPELLLIGVDPQSHEVLLTGQAACSITLDQITQFVRGWVRPGNVHSFAPPTTGA